MKFLVLLLALLAFTPAANARLGAEGFGGVTQTVTVTGINCNPCTSSTSANSGDLVGSLSATVSGGPSLLSPSFALVADDGSGMVVNGTNLQIGASAPAAATYHVQISVQGSNTAPPFTPQTFTVNAVVSSGLSITGISASGCSVNAGAPQGTNVCTMTPTYAGGSPATQSVACGATGAGCISNEFQVGGTNPFLLQVGSAGVTAGSPVPTFTVTAPGATNSPATFTVPVTVNATPVQITGITTSPSPCAGTVGDAQGTSACTLTATCSGGSCGTVSYSITCGTCNSNGGRFQISGTALQAGAVGYSSGPYSNSIQVTSSTATNSPLVVSGVQALIAGGGVPSLVQKRVLSNYGGGSTPAGFWVSLGQLFADQQIQAGDDVLWKTGGGTPIVSQADDCSHYASGSLKFCRFELFYPNSLTVNQQDTIGAYDNPSASFNNTCFGTTALVTNHDFRAEATIAGVTYTLSARNEFSARASTNTIQTDSGPEKCGWYIFGELRNGTGSSATPQGQAWAAIYAVIRADGTYKAEAKVFPCRPLTPAGGDTAPAGCPQLTFTADANGDAYALKDYSLGGDPILMGCNGASNLGTNPTASCVTSGHGNGTGFTGYPGYAYETLTGDGWQFDTQTDVHQVLPAFPVFASSDTATRSLVDGHVIWNILTNSTQNTNIATGLQAYPMYGPNVCSSSAAQMSGCATGQSGPSEFIGLVPGDFAGCYLLGSSPSGATPVSAWKACRNARLMALSMDSVGLSWRDATTGRQVNLNGHFTPPTGAMRTSTTVVACLGTGGTIACTNAPGHVATLNHDPQFTLGACVLWGERSLCDMVLDQASADIMLENAGNIATGTPVNGVRNVTVNTHQYYATVELVNTFRQVGWVSRDLSDAAWIAPEKLADQVTANPDQLYAVAQYVGTGCSPCGNLPYLDDVQTPGASNYYVPEMRALGFWNDQYQSAGGQGPMLIPHQDTWMNAYGAQVWYRDIARGFATLSNHWFAEFLHKQVLGMAVNGCQAFAAASENYSLTVAAHPYSTTTAGRLAQNWSDVFLGSVEAPTPTPPVYPLPGQTAGSTVVVAYRSTADAALPLVGDGFSFNPGYASTGGYSIPQETTLTSTAPYTSGSFGSCPTTACATLGLSNPLSGGALSSTFTGSISGTTLTVPGSVTGPPLAIGMRIILGASAGTVITAGSGTSWTVSVSQTVGSTAMEATLIQFTFTPWGGPAYAGAGIPNRNQVTLIGSCPAQGLDTVTTNNGNFNEMIYLYGAAVAADSVGESYGTTIRNYWENFTGASNPGGVKDLGDCAGGYENWNTKPIVGFNSFYVTFPQWHVGPVGGPALDGAGRATGCN